MKPSSGCLIASLLFLLGTGNVAYSFEVASESVKGPVLDMTRIRQGRYLAQIAGCNDCHTEEYLLSDGKVAEENWLTGSGLGWRGPWGTTYAANLRLLVDGLTEAQWLTLARTLRTRPPMPWYVLHQMRESDLRALYHFIRYLGPGGGPVPAYVQPDQEPSTPYALFPSPPQKSN